MGEWTNAGVEPPHNKSKRAFREAVKEDSGAVMLYGTSIFKPFSDRLVDLPKGKYSVVGPWPDRQRVWYATLVVSTSSTGVRLYSVE